MSISSSSNSSMMNKSVTGNKPNFHNYLCPKCKMQYRYFAKRQVFHGKIPLILHCNHTLCEECVQDSFRNGGVTCVECGHFSTVISNGKQTFQEIFSVNFYLLGAMSYIRPHQLNYDSRLKPTGVSYTNLLGPHVGSSSALCNRSESLELVLQDKCCKDLCKNFGTLKCLECNDVFCEYCCEPFHNSTRGMRKHRIVSSTLNIVPEVLENCAVHTNNALELYCKTCTNYFCCYCIIQDHNGHDYCQISKADFMDAEEYRNLIENAGLRLKRLILAHKNVKEHIQRASQTSKLSIDEAIATYFLKLHAKLQRLEERIRNDAETIQIKNVQLLTEIDCDLRSSIRNLNGLIETALNVNNDNSKKVNVRELTEKLKYYQTIPCYLVGEEQSVEGIEFQYEDPFENLENSITLRFRNSENKLRLLSEDELPEHYQMDLPNDLASLDVFNLNRSLSKSSESISSSLTFPFSPSTSISSSRSKPSKTSPQPNTTQGWLKDSQVSTFKKPPSLKCKDRHSVCISYIITPEHFYVQLVSQLQDLQRLNKEINMYGKHYSSCLNKIPEIGSLYIVKYEEQDWYRGRVVGIEKNASGNNYTVEFVDYGNTKTFTDIKSFVKINDTLSTPPPFAHSCKLFDIYPAASTWSERETLYMAEIIAEGRKLVVELGAPQNQHVSRTEVIMVIVELTNGILEVDLLSCSGGEATSIRDALLFAGYGVCESSSNPISSPIMQSIKSNTRLHLSGQNLKNGDELTVYISHVINLQSIYVQVADHIHHVEHLNAAMGDYYKPKDHNNSRARIGNIYAPKKDMVVAVNISGTFYRATVTQIIQGKGSVVVVLLDYGKIVTVHYKQLRKLPDEFRTLESQAVLVKLSHLKRVDDQEMETKIKAYLQEYIKNKTKLRLVVVNKEEIPSVVLFELFGTFDSCLNKCLVDEALAQPLGDISELLHYSQCSQQNSNSKNSYVFDLMNTIQSSKETGQQEDSDSEDCKNVIKKRVHVLSCKSPDEIYVEVENSSRSKSHAELHSALQEYYSTKPKNENQHWAINDLCVAYNSNCQEFFRGIIISKTDDKLKVMLRDIGQEIIVPQEDVYVLHDQFKQCTERALRCHLASVVPAGDKNKWSGLAIDFLHNIFEQHHDISMTKTGAIDHKRKSFPITMWYMETKPGGALERSKQVLHNINKLLIKNGLALKEITNLGSNFSLETRTLRESEITKDQDVCISPADKTKLPFSEQVNSPCTVQENSSEYHSLFFNPTSNKNEQFSLKLSNNVADIVKLQPMAPKGCQTFVENFIPQKPPSLVDIINGEMQSPILSDIQRNHTTSNFIKHREEQETVTTKHSPLLNSEDEQILLMQKHPHMVINNKNNDWLPPTPFIEKHFVATVTNVDSNGCIFAHPSSKKTALNYMIEKMNSYFKKTFPEPLGTVWRAGQICTVRYHLNGEWYRGKINKVEKGTIKVFMIDFGNEEEVQHDDLRFGVMYLDLPAFANKIQLYQVYPVAGSTWLTSDLDELHKMLVENEVEVNVIKKSVKPEIPISALVKLHNVNINEYMRSYSTNLVISPSSASSTDTEEDVIIEDDVLDSAVDLNTGVTQSFTQESLPESLVGQKIEVTLTSVMNYDQVLLEILFNRDVDETKELFDSISEDIRIKGEKQQNLKSFTIGSACIARFSEDGQWYRGEIVNLDEIDRDEVHIWFVDFGNSESVSRNCIKTVDPDWLKLPVLQYKANIVGIKLSDMSCLNVVLEWLYDSCNTHKLAEIISVDPLSVKLYSDEELMYQDLIDQGLLIKTD